MRLITRSDFDGLVCGALLKEAGIIDSWKFAHPKDLQDGLVEVTEDDCLANVPFVEGVVFGLTITLVNLREISLKEDIKVKVVLLLLVRELFMNITVEMKDFLTLMKC